MRAAPDEAADGTASRPGAATATDLRVISLLSLAHASVDLNPSALAALLPTFYAVFHLSYGATALITAVSQITNSACQLPFGYLADRVSLRWLIGGGCLLAGLGLALAGLAPSYPVLLLAIVVSGLGVAMFHPEAARTANRVSGQRRATAMSIFSVGGNAGFACGPLAASLAAALLNRGGSLLFLLPALMVTGVLRLANWQPAAHAAAPHAGSTVGARAAGRLQLALLMMVAIIRSALQVGILTFVPLFEVTVLQRPQAYASAMMTAFLGLGALGTLVAGMAADRWGRQPTVLASFLLAVPLLFVFRHSDGPLAFVTLALSGGFLLSTFAVTIVMGQELLPHRTGVAAGLTIGLASGIGGASIGLLGHLADVAGLGSALDVLTVLPIVAAGCAFGLAKPRKLPRLTRGPVAGRVRVRMDEPNPPAREPVERGNQTLG